MLMFCWCDFGEKNGKGQCYEGGFDGPTSEIACVKPSETWSFLECPICQCNGHSLCNADGKTCKKCEDLTMGDNCETCVEGYWGDARNSGVCSPCDCKGRANTCGNRSGKCLCKTKWTSGRTCEECHPDGNGQVYKKHWSNITNDYACFMKLATNFQYTIPLQSEKDKYITQLNTVAVLNKEIESDDVIITIETSNPVVVTFSIVSYDQIENVPKDKTIEDLCKETGNCEEKLMSSKTEKRKPPVVENLNGTASASNETIEGVAEAQVGGKRRKRQTTTVAPTTSTITTTGATTTEATTIKDSNVTELW